MANRVKGEAALGDYTLVFDINAMCLLEEETGLKTGELLAKMQEGIGISELRSFIWAGLQDRHPEITIKAAGGVIGDFGIEESLKALEEAITAAFASDQKATPARPRKAAKAGTG